jgi:flagellar protein FliJ
MPFHFRLETLLRLRQAERDQRRADLAKALRAEALLQSERQRLGGEQAGVANDTRRLKAPGAANIDGLMQAHRYERVLVAHQQQLAAQLAQVQAEAERRRLALVEADRQVRVLEKLRERQAASHRTQEQKQEIRQLDEVALTGFVRRGEAGP